MSAAQELEDRRYMAAALALGRQGLGRTAPNPSVGALIVRTSGEASVVVGSGRTADGGRPHAERVALAMAGAAARGATCYATLEPCSHIGRSGPCADALIEAGIGGVVVATADPNPLVAGQGIERLRRAGVEVRLGVREAEARRDLAGHISRMTRGRPHVALKLAVSSDGAIGRRGFGQVALTGPASNARVHLMRAEADAIAVGVGTVLADDPRLTCRLPGLADASPLRVIFDTNARTPPDARLFSEAGAPVLVIVGEGTEGGHLRAAGAQVIEVPRSPQNRLELSSALARLGERGVMRLMVEGGARFAEALVCADLIDEAHWIATPTPIGGDLVVPFGGRGIDGLAQRLRVVHRERVRSDRWTTLERRTCSPAS